MQVQFEIDKTYRDKVFVETGAELPSKVKLDIDATTLPRDVRERIAAEVKAGFGVYPLTVPGHYNSVYKADAAIAAHLPEQAADIFTDWFAKLDKGRACAEAARATHIATHEPKLRDRMAQMQKIWDEGGAYFSGTLGLYDGDKLCPSFAEAKALQDKLVAREHERETAKRAAEAVEEAADSAARAATKALLNIDKREWIEAHGSDFLKKAVGADYNCQRAYVSERAALEFPGYVVDFQDNANWDSRACPSEKALDEALRVKGTAVWLTSPAQDEAPHRDDDDYEGRYESCEAVVIIDYLSKYDLVREF
jgi:hypothetical protein